MAEPPSPPYIPAKHHGGHQSVIKRIVIHSTVSDTYCGGARAIAAYFQNPTYVSSAHYAVDPCEVIQMVWDNTVAWHDGTNTNSIGVEMCERPSRDPQRWNSRQHRELLKRTASLTRQLCLAYGVPIRRIGPDQIRAGEKGICGHEDMSAAYPANSSHWDPGAFPWSAFMRMVRSEEDDMPTAEEVAEAVWTYNIPSGHESNPEWWAQTFIKNIESDQDYSNSVLRQLLAGQTGLAAAVAALSTDADLTPERVGQIVRDAVQQSIEITGTVHIGAAEEGTTP